MKFLLCSFNDLCHGAGNLGANRIGLQHVPFTEDSIIRADVVAVLGSNRALILKNRTGLLGVVTGVANAAELTALIESEASK